MMNNDTRYKINLEMSLNYNEFWMVKGVEVLFWEKITKEQGCGNINVPSFNSI